MNTYELAKANTTTVFDKAYQEGAAKFNTQNLMAEVNFLMEGDEEEVSNYIEDNTHPDR